MLRDSIHAFMNALADHHNIDIQKHRDLIISYSLYNIKQIWNILDSRSYNHMPMDILFHYIYF